MRITDSHPQVVIAGAGPSGLMMAAQLLRYGIQPVILDSRQGPTSRSKALAVQARSMEIYRQMGLSDRVVKDSAQARGMRFHQEGKETAWLDMDNAGNEQTPFPYVYLYEQFKTERLLLDFLTQNCCPVYWNTTLIDVQQQATNCTLRLETEGEPYQIDADWLIGADGAHSTVRKKLQISFKGDTYPHSFFLADVQLNNDNLNHRDLQLYFSKKGFAAFFLMPEQDCYRIVGSLPPAQQSNSNLQLGDIEAHLNQVTGFQLQVVKNRWFTTYKLHHRMAEKFSNNQCYLIGDAAHIHSPVGGQGMNTGLQDAYNLAWKLAGVINNQWHNDILATYAAERMPIAAELLQTTDRAFNVVTSGNMFIHLFKSLLLPGLLNWAWKKERIRKMFFERISQTGIQYRNSKLNLHLSRANIIKAGDRLPYLKIFDEKKKQYTDLHAWCSKPGFTLITFGALTESELFALAKWITQNYNGFLNFFHLPPSEKNEHVFERLEIKKGLVKALVVRPDMHIGLVADSTEIEILNTYFKNIIRVF